MMSDELITALVKEIRTDYNIPPYHKDEKIKVLVKEADQYLSGLVANVDYDKDLIARGLLKNRVFYAHNKRLNEFETDYSNSVTGWQFNQLEAYKEADEDVEDEEVEDTDI